MKARPGGPMLVWVGKKRLRDRVPEIDSQLPVLFEAFVPAGLNSDAHWALAGSDGREFINVSARRFFPPTDCAILD